MTEKIMTEEKILKGLVVVDEIYKGRRIVVAKIPRSRLKTMMKSLHLELRHPDWFKDYHCGYIETKKKSEDKLGFPEEITYHGKLDQLGIKTTKNFIGFDMAHAWNFENPKTQTKMYVLYECKRMVNIILKTNKVRENNQAIRKLKKKVLR